MEKERRTKALVVVVLLIVIAGLTVAFAALSSSLNIKGTAYLDAAKWGIKFENLSEPESVGTATTTGTAKIEETKSAEITGINVGLSTPGDKVTYTVDLVNEGTINAKIDKIEKTVLTEEQQKYLTFKVTYKDGTEVSEGDILSKGERKNLIITIEFIKDLTKEDLPTKANTISLSYKLNFVQTDDEDKELTGTPSMLAAGTTEDGTGTFFGGKVTKNKIESVTFKSTTDVPSDSIDSWDASLNKDGSVMAYYKDDDKNDLYELYIGAQGGVKAPSDSSNLFAYFTNLKTIDFGSSFNTYNVVNMAKMFNNCTSLTNLDLSGFNTINVSNIFAMFQNCSSLTSLDLSNFNTSNVTDMRGMFNKCSSLTSLDLSNFNTSNVTNMYAMFNSCSSLTSLNLSNFNTSNVTDMKYMFYKCSSLTSLNLSNFDTSKVTTMMAIFANCESLKELNVSKFDTSNVTDMTAMFQRCLVLTNLNLSNFNTLKVTDMKYMFFRCENLGSLDISSFNTKNVTNMSYMFYQCEKISSLNLSDFETSKVTNMHSMFEECHLLTYLDVSNFNTSNVTDMAYMFLGCKSLTSLDLSNFNTSKVTNMRSMFNQCEKISSLNLSNFNTSKVTSMYEMFSGATGLTNLDLSSFDFSKVTETYGMFYIVPSDSLIYAKNDASKEFILKVRNDLTNVQIKS